MAARGTIGKRCSCRGEDGKQLGQKCPKLWRGNNTYSPTHGRWFFSITVRIKGQKKQILRSGFASKEEAQDALDKVRQAHARGVDVSKRVTVKEWVWEWLESKEDIRPATRATYRSHFKNHIVPHLGHLLLTDLRASDVKRMLDDVPGTDATRQRVRGALRTALNDAIRQGVIERNPAELVRMSSGRSPRTQVWTEANIARWRETGERPSPSMVWTAQQLGQFLDHVADHRLYALFWLLSHRGLRRGESLGLTWGDLDLERGTATTSIQRIKVRGEIIESAPKSVAGDRTVALGVEGIEVLKAHRLLQRKEQLKARRWVESGKVFTTPNGEAMSPPYVTRLFKKLVREADLPPVRLHDLRHGSASLMRHAGIDPKVIQETLGHSDLRTTMNIYTSVYPEAGAAAADALSAIVPRSRKVAE